MTIHGAAGKKRDHFIRKKRARGTNMRQVMVVVIVVVMVGHHDTQHERSKERARTGKDKTTKQTGTRLTLAA